MRQEWCNTYAAYVLAPINV